jgi:hypothetical protein
MSLLVSFSKVFEKLIYKRLYEHISTNNILDTEQYGFGTNTSTENDSYKLTHEIQSDMSNKCAVGGIFCDLEKESDCANHNILLEKLQFYGIVGKFQALMKSHPSERHQNVFIDNINSSNGAAFNWEEVKHGVPQGSILCPLFFLVYINNLPKITSSLDGKTSDASTSPRSMSDKVDKKIADHNKWTVITSKCPREGFTSKNLTELNTTYSLTTANYYEQLTYKTRCNRWFVLEFWQVLLDDNKYTACVNLLGQEHVVLNEGLNCNVWLLEVS